jgi:hypothetical protein
MKAPHRNDRPAPGGGAVGRMIVVEHGALALDAFTRADGSEETTLVAEGVGDPPLDLPFRVVGRLALIERGRVPVSRALLFVAPRLDTESVAARELTARTLLSHMGAAGGGELVLVGDGADVDLRHSLLALVETLVLDHEKIPVVMRLQFRTAPARPSGVYPIVTSVSSSSRAVN